MGCFAAYCVFALTKYSLAPEGRKGYSARIVPITAISRAYARPGLGQFPPITDAERELERMLQGKDEDIDLALANWLIIADIPEFSNLTRTDYLARLDSAEQRVRSEMDRMRTVAVSRGKSLNDPDVRCSIFCNAVRKLGFAYNDEFTRGGFNGENLAKLYSDPNNIVLAGLLRTGSGSCVSMPQIYLILGLRLGYPVHLVSVGRHCFLRWQEPGYRMNIETTIVQNTSVTDDDNVFLDAEGIRPDEVKGSMLRNKTRREVLGDLFFARAGYWRTRRDATRDCYDISRARHLSPDDPAIQTVHNLAFTHYGIQPHHKSLEIILNPEPK